MAITLDKIYQKLLDLEGLLTKDNRITSPSSYAFIDKSSWPDGPWKTEPDRITWTDEATGLPCIINRLANDGFLCGYVGVPDSHKLYCVRAGEVDVTLDAHQGIDFSGIPLTNQADRRGLSHLRDWYWFGFACSYWNDFLPASPAYWKLLARDIKFINDYRDAEYVKSECKNLASQLAAIG